MSVSLEIFSEEEMVALGEALGSDLTRPSVVLLTGEMGVGKTRLVQGLAKTLNVDKRVTSPTFLTVKEYPTPKGKFIHCDLYRVSTDDYLEEVGVLDELEQGAIVAIEWPRNYKVDMEIMFVEVEIRRGRTGTSRWVSMEAFRNERPLSSVKRYSKSAKTAST